MKKITYIMLLSCSFTYGQNAVVKSDSILLLQGGGQESTHQEIIDEKVALKNPELMDTEKATLNPIYSGFSIIMIGGKNVYFKQEGQLSTILEPND